MMLALEVARTLYKTPALVSHRVRCGKPNCRCADGEGHGPYHFLLWREGTVQRRCYVRQADVAAVREACDARRTGERVARRATGEAWRHWRRLVAVVREVEPDA